MPTFLMILWPNIKVLILFQDNSDQVTNTAGLVEAYI